MIDMNDFELAPITKVKQYESVTDDTNTSCMDQSKRCNTLKIILGTLHSLITDFTFVPETDNVPVMLLSLFLSLTTANSHQSILMTFWMKETDYTTS